MTERKENHAAGSKESLPLAPKRAVSGTNPTAGRSNPFAVFEEWASEADDEAYESL
ncbi:MAG: hypothetical protein J0H53_11040 [Rhizobiales bacterium]|nr:hypothetical protein [Hyphomicrobiales bacterium]